MNDISLSPPQNTSMHCKPAEATLTAEATPSIPLSYTEARALYEQAEKALLKVQVSIRGFIFSRWILGSYFEKEKKALGPKWQAWLKEKWPEVSLKTAMLWIAFHSRTSLSSIQDSKLPTLKNDYLHSLHA